MADSVVPAVPEVDSKVAPIAKVEEATREIKVNGKVQKMTDAQLIAAAQKGLFADQKLKSMDVLKGKTESLLSSLKTPEGALNALKELGVSPDALLDKIMDMDITDEKKEKLSKWVYKNVVQESKLTPEEVEKNKKLTDYERLKKAEDERKGQETAKQQQEQVQQVYQAVRAEVTKQILADKTFPQTEPSIRQVIEKLRVMNKKGVAITTESVGKALELVKKDHILNQQELFDKIEDPEALIAFFGEARALRISKALVSRLQAKAKVKAQEVKEQEKTVREKVTDRIDKKLGRTPQGYSVLDV